MASKDKDIAPKRALEDGIVSVGISHEMRTSYLDYAMSVITSRALPDVRDGLKPVHRRILYAMNEIGLTSSAKTRKSSNVVGEVLGKYHPHGDVAVYDSMVKMTQDFSMRYPLIVGQGNFGSIDGDSAAAMRYTEAKMSKISSEMLRDLDKETVEWRPNYDNTKKEPAVLPASLPNLLLNGTLGIAVGMATSVPPHNLNEVVDATIHLIDDEEATNEDLLTYVKGPDFPTGGIIFADKEVHHAYASGRGGVVCRGEAEIIETKSGQFQIIISSIPYRVNKADLIVHIADLVHEKKLEGIKDIRDESTKDIRIVIDLKTGIHPQKVLNYLYKHSELENVFHFNVLALVDGVPQTLSLRAMLKEFISHREVIVRRRTEFDLKKALEREHILLGLKKALDHIDQIIKTIKSSKDTPTAHANLMKEFKFSAIQATAILEMKLQKLAGLERKKIEEELSEVQDFISKLKELLSSAKKILKVVKDELVEAKAKYGDERRTKVIKGGVKVISEEDLIPEKESVLVYTAGGYVKRTDPAEYRVQKRGGVGVVDLDTKEEDFVTHLLTANTHSDLLFFTDKGKAYQIKMYDIPEGRRATKGKSIMNFLQLGGDEKVTSILAMPKAVKNATLSILMVTKEGTAKKVSAESFKDVRRNGIIAIKLSEGDLLLSTLFTDKGDEVILATKKGQAIRFKESDIREMGRAAGGVRGMKLGRGDVLIGADVVKKESKGPMFLVMMENGFGKRTAIKEYKVQKRGGSGIKTAKVTAKTGNVMAAEVVSEDMSQIIAMSKKSQVVRVDLSSVPSLGRQTQGVRIMKLRAGDSIASLTCL
ncbi:MAG: DNA gyrase subunit A [Candidatus Paceibacterota bacterium]|jgi:DNA gyrase subunit A